jgi:hypothetical protein
MRSGAFAAEVRAAERAWQQAGIHSVPAVVINDRHLIQGGQPPEVFEQALRQIAASRGGKAPDAMARNIEIKARIASVESCCRAPGAGRHRTRSSSTRTTASSVPHGRLKLRQFADGSAELIHYHRPDSGPPRPATTCACRWPTPPPARSAGARLRPAGRVRKRRWLLLVGATRIHLDRWKAWATSWNWKWCCKTARATPRARRRRGPDGSLGLAGAAPGRRLPGPAALRAPPADEAAPPAAREPARSRPTCASPCHRARPGRRAARRVASLHAGRRWA